MSFAAVVVAAGRSARFGPVKKEYRLLDGRPVLAHSLSLFLDMADCLAVAAVVPPGGEGEARAALGQAFLDAHGGRLVFAAGGDERHDSVRAGLAALARFSPALVLVHDGARPFATELLARRVLAGIDPAAGQACVPGVPVTDTVKRVDGRGLVDEHLKRASLCAIQTPQGFPYAALVRAYGRAPAGVTDDAEVWAASGGAVLVADGERGNRKITFAEDLP